MPTSLPFFLTALVTLGWQSFAQAQAAPPIQFPPAPRLAATPAEIARLKETGKDAAVQAATLLLKNPVPVPQGWGNWVFYYACPDDGTDLTARNEQEHVCPRCKKVYQDERTQAAYRTLLHDRVNAAALQLAWAYAFTGEEPYAKEVQRLLTRLADDYPTYPARKDRWGRTGWLAQLGGRRYSQSLDEAVGVIQLAKAYDLTRAAACWTDKSRQHVEKDFFRQTADTLLFANRDINNHQTWYNAGLMACGSVLGDADLVHKVLNMRGGFHDQLKRSVGDDGLWYEGTMAYHNYALQAMIEIVSACRRLGLPLHQEKRFRSMIEAPLQCAYPNGQFPAMNDSDQAHVSSFAASFKWAWETYKEPIFAQAYAGGDTKRLQELLGPQAKAQPFLETRSRNLPGIGLAILRHGQGAKAACVMVDHGPHGGAHGHYDKLNLVLFANGQEWLLDPGRLTYSHKEYQTWVKHTAAHNTVTLGGKSQAPHTGKLLWFRAEKDWSACAVQSDDAYPNARLRRYLFLGDRLLVDLFEVQAAAETTIDLLAHAQSQRVIPMGDRGPGVDIVPGQKDGYQHLTAAKSWTVAGPSQWDFVSGERKLRLWFDGLAKEDIIACTGIGYSIDAKVPCLIRRVRGQAARFVTVYELSGAGNFVQGVQRDKDGVSIRTTLGHIHCAFSDQGIDVREKK